MSLTETKTNIVVDIDVHRPGCVTIDLERDDGVWLGRSMTADQARDLAKKLTELADEVEAFPMPCQGSA